MWTVLAAAAVKNHVVLTPTTDGRPTNLTSDMNQPESRYGRIKRIQIFVSIYGEMEFISNTARKREVLRLFDRTVRFKSVASLAQVVVVLLRQVCAPSSRKTVVNVRAEHLSMATIAKPTK
jgi:hypothetical protein